MRLQSAGDSMLDRIGRHLAPGFAAAPAPDPGAQPQMAPQAARFRGQTRHAAAARGFRATGFTPAPRSS